MITIISWTLTIIQATAIFYLSSLPSVGLPMFWQSDKVFHAIAYFVLAFLFSWSLSRHALPAKKIFLIAVIICSLYGLSDEFHQLFVPNRNSEFLDLVADAVGATLGALTFVKFFRANRFRKENS